MTTWLLCILGAYLVGAIPFGLLIAKARGVDIRKHGSKNIGATNVGRVLGRNLGVACFLLDMLKGAGPVIAAGLLCHIINRPPSTLTQGQMWLWLAVAAAAVLGHMASLFLGFRGGKGVATGFGAALGMWPLLTLPAIGALVVWYATLRMTRYMSAASMAGAVSLPFWFLVSVKTASQMMDKITHAYPVLLVTLALAGIVVWRHRDNIARLRRHQEPRINL